MKKLIMIVFICGFLFSNFAYADLTDGLMAYYPFNGSADDASGNNNHGTIYGATLTVDRFGNLDNAYEIVGNTGPYGSGIFIEIPDVIEGFQNLTISLWVNEYYQSYSHGEAYISFGVYEEEMVNVAHQGNDQEQWLIYTLYNTNDAEQFKIPWSDSWFLNYQHYVLVYDGVNGELEYYQNGNLIGAAAISPGAIATYGTYAGLGVHWGGSGNERYTRFNGVIDDVRIYNRALSQNEILELYNEPNPAFEPPVARAGLDQVVFNEAFLDGSASSCDSDNYIESYLWEADLDGDKTYETLIGDEAVVELDSVVMESLDLYGKITEFRLTVFDNNGASDTDTLLLAVAGLCAGWPEPNAELSLKRFKIMNFKRWDYTTISMFGTIDLPEQIDLDNGDMVDSRITIELFGALEGGNDLVISDEATFTVKDRKQFLMIKK